MPRQPVGPLIQFAVNHPVIAQFQRDCLGLLPGLFLEQLLHAAVPWIIRPPSAPFLQQLSPLRLAQHRQLGQAPAWISHRRVEQVQIVLRQPAHRGRIKKIRVVFQNRVQLAARLLQTKREVKHRHARIHRHDFQGQVPQPQRLGRRVLQYEHHLEQRLMTQVALRVQRLDQLLERQILILERPQRRRPHPLQSLPKLRVAGQIAAQHQRVGHEPDQALQFRPLPVGDRRAHHDVFLSGVARQQGLEHRQRRHEQRRAFPRAECLERIRQLARNGEVMRRPAKRLHRRSWPVGGKFQRRHPVTQLPVPETQLPLKLLAAQPLPLPLRIVRVLNHHRWQRRGTPRHARLVKTRHLPQENPVRPAVRNDVMHRPDQRVILGPKFQQQHAQQRPLRQIERMQALFDRAPLDCFAAPLLRQAWQFLHAPRHRLAARHHLHRSLARELEGRAQGLVPSDHFLESRLQRLLVQRPAQPHRFDDVVARVPRQQLIEEPQPLLRRGQGKLALPRQRLNRREIRPGWLRLLLQALDLTGERPKRRRAEHDRQGQFHFQFRAQARHQLGREQGMAPEREKIILHPDPLQLQQLSGQLGDELLRAGVRGVWPTGTRSRPAELEQGAAIHLAARQHRQRLQHHKRGRQHVGGQPLREKLSQLIHSDGPHLPRHDVGDEPLLLVAMQRHRRRAQPRMCQQGGFYLAHLDAEPAHLHLIIKTSEEFDLAVGPPANPISGAVEPRSIAEGMRHKFFRRQLRAIPVTPRQPDAAHAQFTRHADGHRL